MLLSQPNFTIWSLTMFNAQTLKAFAHGAAQGVALVSAAVAGSLIAAQILASAAKKD